MIFQRRLPTCKSHRSDGKSLHRRRPGKPPGAFSIRRDYSGVTESARPSSTGPVPGVGPVRVTPGGPSLCYDGQPGSVRSEPERVRGPIRHRPITVSQG
eukprot:750711-Hanusia_phi.AAC.1